MRSRSHRTLLYEAPVATGALLFLGAAILPQLKSSPSKKLENHAHAVALHVFHYNFCRLHQTLKVTPAMEARVTDRLWEIADIVRLIDEATPPPGPRGPYENRRANGENSN